MNPALYPVILGRRNSGPAAIIRGIYAGGAQGAWYDPSDLSTLYQDTARTMPVTAVGQAVALMLDKSGRGNHASQPVAAARPLLAQNAKALYSLKFDGVDDCLFTASASFAGMQMFQCMGFGTNSAKNGAALELTALPDTTTGSFNLYVPNGGTSITENIRGASVQNNGTFTLPAVGTPIVMSAAWDFSQATAANQKLVNINNVPTANTGTQVADAVPFASAPLYISRRGNVSDTLDLSFYGCILVGRITTPAEQLSIRSYINSKTGAY